jgi:hypothetical protein
MDSVKIYFDGDCFFCKNFVALSKLRSRISVELVDLLLDQKIDINSTFVVEVDHGYLFKNFAMAFLLRRMGYFRLAWLFEKKIIGAALYDALVLLRRLYLFVAGKTPFRNHCLD